MRLLPGLVALDRPLPEFLSANAHAFTRADLRARWSRAALENAVRSGDARRILPGVYCARAHTGSPTVLGEALNLWHPAGLVTGPLALHLYGVPLTATTVAHIRVQNGFRPRTPPWVRCLQGERLRVSSAPAGVSCVVPELALLDAWRLASPPQRLDILWESLWARVCTWQQLARAEEGAARIPERHRLQRVLGWFEDGATTPLEVRARHEAFAGRRFSGFERQVGLRLPTRHATVDMLHRAARVIVELDGDRYHSTREARDADRERQTDLTAAGWVVLRFGWRDIVDRPAWCRERVLAVVASRLARPSGT
ncbi:type IV toxin-antitoxin system AbiEi family antitoxin domain-containing protein [Demequina subtropica]|uniref:type IV toxin-antitoxin system AbiEi family antitoxin domain-containing protein n=1 Tax=Demequina subtropica TaxID=1638989 RepID=UPI0007857A9C|nr:type IV toxin-antitoxin system AbiEi family antitoxin domain-containing protein [Demequina subtropica]